MRPGANSIAPQGAPLLPSGSPFVRGAVGRSRLRGRGCRRVQMFRTPPPAPSSERRGSRPRAQTKSAAHRAAPFSPSPPGRGRAGMRWDSRRSRNHIPPSRPQAQWLPSLRGAVEQSKTKGSLPPDSPTQKPRRFSRRGSSHQKLSYDLRVIHIAKPPFSTPPTQTYPSLSPPAASFYTPP